MQGITEFRESDRIREACEREEQILLGKILLDDRNDIGMSTVAGKLRADMFSSPKHGRIYRAMEALHDRVVTVEIAALWRELESGAKPDGMPEVKPEYISGLTGIASTEAATEEVETYAALLLEAHMRRRGFEELARIAQGLNDKFQPVGDVLTQAGIDFTAIVADAEDVCRKPYKSLYELELEVWKEYEEHKKNGGGNAITTGLGYLDKTLSGGWQPCQLIVVGARIGVGKTSFALHCARAAVEAGKAVMFFSLEMSERQMAIKTLHRELNFSTQGFICGGLDNSTEQRICEEIGKHAGVRLHFSTRVDVSVAQIAAISRNMQMRGLCDMVIVDYLQLVNIGRQKSTYRNRENEVAEITRALKLFALSAGIPVMVLCQLNRESEKREGRKPAIADLRESGAIEQDADTVILIHRPQEKEPQGRDDSGQGTAMVVKNRMGQCAAVEFGYSSNLCRLWDVTGTQAQENTVPSVPTLPEQAELPF
jgi:replicative DNA helicase